jgi:hypothetical protein
LFNKISPLAIFTAVAETTAAQELVEPSAEPL